jgi:hypothetical protein
MRALLCLLLLLACGAAHAHKPSDSYLHLRSEQARIDGQWDIALRDLDYAIGLDTDQDGAITWGEVRSRHAQIAAFALARLSLHADTSPCSLSVSEHLIDRHGDGAYAVLRLSGECPQAPRVLEARYRLFFDLDAQHRGLLRLEHGGQTRSAIFAPDSSAQRFELAVARPWRQFADYLRHGVWHIWIGFDHILFLLALLLPAVLVRREGDWVAADSLKPVVTDVVKVVTAFTLAHSVTLSLAALGLATLPARWVESAIAASVVLAALNNVYPLVRGRRWLLAFAFGLVHGFGFASVLADLGLPRESLVSALIAFNLGVELGQLAIVAAFLPLAWWLRGSTAYRRGVLAAGSLAVGAVALVWLAERALDLRLIS